MSIEGQDHFFIIYFPGFVCFVLYKATISGERLQDHWSSGFVAFGSHIIVHIVHMQIVFKSANDCFEPHAVGANIRVVGHFLKQ